MNFLADNTVLPTDIFNAGGFRITYYAIFILVGALLALLIGKIEYKKMTGDSSKMDTLFVVSLFAGIVGARIWYVIAQWNVEFKNASFLDIIAIWNGGLAIQGGALLGVLVGVIHVKLWMKETPALEVVDAVAPGILLAQAVGRIGNFFNREVYGKPLTIEGSIFEHFPDWFLNQLRIASVDSAGNVTYIYSATEMAQPLFLYEGIINIIGFLFLFFILHKAMKKILPAGTVGGAYFIWYGLTRIFMEPLRNPDYQMGDGVMASKMMAYGFVGLGVLIIIVCIILKATHKNKKASVKEMQKEIIQEIEETPLTRQEVGITKYSTPEKYRAHDFSDVEDSDILTEEDLEEAKELVKEDDSEEQLDDFIVVEGPKQEEPEEEIIEEEPVEEPVEEEEEVENYEPRVVEIEEGDYEDLTKINKFVEKDPEVEESILEGYRTQYNPDAEKNVAEDEVNEVEETIVEPVEEASEIPEVDGQPLIFYKNGFGPDNGKEEPSEEKNDVEGKNVVEIEEGDYEDQTKINKFVDKNPEVEESILEGYRTQYNPQVEKNVEEDEVNEVEETIDVDLEDEKVPSIGEPSIEFKQCPPPVRSDIEEESTEEPGVEAKEPIEEEQPEEPIEEEQPEEPIEEEQPEEPIEEEQPEESIEEEQPEEPIPEDEENEEELDADEADDEEESEEDEAEENEDSTEAESDIKDLNVSIKDPRFASVKKVSFAEKLEKASPELKDRNEKLNEFILSYKNVKYRLSNSGATYRYKGKKYVYVSILGKTLRVYVAVDPTTLNTNVYHQKDVSDKKKYATTPSLLRVKSDMGLKKAMKLIEQVFADNNVPSKKK